MGIYNTNKKPGIEPGIHTVRVSAYPQEVMTQGGFLMISMEFNIEGSEYPIKQRFFPNQLSGMFKVLGFKEVEPGVFDGDIHQAYDQSFKAEVYLEDYIKDGEQKKARRLRNFGPSPSITIDQISGPGEPKTPEEIWNE